MVKIRYNKFRYPGLDQRGAWFITDNDNYLHSDGVTRYSTRNVETNEYTGYFETFSEALTVMNKHLEINNGNTN